MNIFHYTSFTLFYNLNFYLLISDILKENFECYYNMKSSTSNMRAYFF